MVVGMAEVKIRMSLRVGDLRRDQVIVCERTDFIDGMIRGGIAVVVEEPEPEGGDDDAGDDQPGGD